MGRRFAHEEKRDMPTAFETIDTNALGVRYVNRDPDGRYSLTKEMIAIPTMGWCCKGFGWRHARPDAAAEVVCASGAASG